MELAWGRTYVMVEPTHFRVEYVINPFMDPDDQPDPALAMAQWRELVAAIERCGGTVDALPQRADAPDMVYAMNLGLGLVAEDGTPQVVMSHMRYPQRRMETESAQPWFAERGFATSYVGRDGVGAHLEAGDAFAFGDALVVGYGPRTEELALKHLAADLGIRVRGQLEEWGFEIVLVDVSEFHKGGGSIRCLTNPVDVRIGRDLPSVPGGEVVLPPV